MDMPKLSDFVTTNNFSEENNKYLFYILQVIEK